MWARVVCARPLITNLIAHRPRLRPRVQRGVVRGEVVTRDDQCLDVLCHRSEQHGLEHGGVVIGNLNVADDNEVIGLDHDIVIHRPARRVRQEKLALVVRHIKLAPLTPLAQASLQGLQVHVVFAGVFVAQDARLVQPQRLVPCLLVEGSP